jgi:hypothetical protein
MPVILHQELGPGVIFAVIPVVIVPVISIIDPDLNSDRLRCRGGHKRQGRREGSGQKQRSEVTMWTVHAVILQL